MTHIETQRYKWMIEPDGDNWVVYLYDKTDPATGYLEEYDLNEQQMTFLMVSVHRCNMDNMANKRPIKNNKLVA